MYEVQGTLTCPPPHPTPTPTHTRDLSSVATCHVVSDPRDLSNMAIYHVRSTRNGNMPPHPTPTPRQRAILKKEAKRTYGFPAVGINILFISDHISMSPFMSHCCEASIPGGLEVPLGMVYCRKNWMDNADFIRGWLMNWWMFMKFGLCHYVTLWLDSICWVVFSCLLMFVAHVFGGWNFYHQSYIFGDREDAA